MTAYDPELWHELFVAVAGAAAALAGLVFVAVSLNLKEILASPGMSSLASRPLTVLISLLLVSVLGLVPDQPRILFGLEIAVLGTALLIITMVSIARSHFPVQRWSWSLSTLGMGLISTVPLVIAGVSIAVGAGGGLYWLIVELITGFIVATANAWIVLIEIQR